MKHKVVIVDTCILLVWLKVPEKGNETGNKKLTYESIENYFNEEAAVGTNMMLTVACIIETGNHIAHIKDGNSRYAAVGNFAQFIEEVASERKSPWMIYSNERDMWTKENIADLARQWKERREYKLSMGDASILKTAQALIATGQYNVDVYTDDQLLESSVLELNANPPCANYRPRNKRNS